ncbi:type I-Fv CRISPR-associated protein Cas5fv [Endozoicomonas sp. 8E]|uniref:type I-Fv CRISPR-associated protein Cas5fv n=1 Tax=Endozoicomonas sp. 8E TaxID=3035692 RepID=UPI002939410C|nr:type I-Fv CRISPR-associated protein Cas5fv [Endozoicomonas sp. 8E]WOG30208.1 type I-Fv CRISPR-associated protein Cas5fv [Endozoicomonas sp. 8E]
MQIEITYESSWRNSFLTGSNNEAVPKKGRVFIGSMTALKKKEEGRFGNFIKHDITHNTVMGILNRLIGDQRKLYQARQSARYYFADIEPTVHFQDKPAQRNGLTQEIVYLRNVTGSTDQQSFTGMIRANDPIFSSNYSAEFWGVLDLELDKLYQFIAEPKFKVTTTRKYEPLVVIEKLEALQKLNAIVVEGDTEVAINALTTYLGDINYLNNKGLAIPLSLYCSALYLQLDRLSKSYDMSSAKTRNGGIGGISKRGFTKKDFMDRYTTGRKKIVWGNPYILKERRAGEGEVVSMLTKASGTLTVNLDISPEKANELKGLIEKAGVSAFYLGKKGLAYVSNIRI